MKKLMQLSFVLGLVFIGAQAKAEQAIFAGKINTRALGAKTLQAAFSLPANSFGFAERHVGVDHDTRDLYCYTRLRFDDVGSVTYSLDNSIAAEAKLGISMGGDNRSISSEEECVLGIYAQSAIDYQSLYIGGYSELILNQRKEGNNTITLKLNMAISIGTKLFEGSLVQLHGTEKYALYGMYVPAKKFHGAYQIVEETRGDYISWSTLEQGEFDLVKQ